MTSSVTSNQRPTSVSSRELGAYLATLATMLGATECQLRLLGIEPGAGAVTAETVDALAHWLHDAKFTVEDPWRYKFVCEQVLKRTAPSDRLHRMAAAALNGESMADFVGK